MSIVFLRILAVLTLSTLGAVGCRSGARAPETQVNAPSRPIADVLAEHSPKLMAIEGVTAVGEGALPDGTPCIRVFLLSPEASARVPRTIEGYLVVYEVTGPIRALPDSNP